MSAIQRAISVRLHFSEPSDSPSDGTTEAVVATGLVTEDLKPASSLQAWVWRASRCLEWCLRLIWRLMTSGRWVTSGLLLASLGWFSASADVGQALGWLQNQVQTSGIVRTLSAVAAPEQTQCEVAQTLLTLSGNGPQVASLVATLQNDGQAVTQTVACRRSLELAAGASPTGTLADRQQSSGGYSSDSDQAGPSLLDTGCALQSEVAALSASDQSLLIGWLQSQQNADGSFGKGSGASLLATAKILNGLKGVVSNSSAAAQIAQKAVTYLLSARDAAGGWASDIGLTAIVFEAVQPYSGSDASIASTEAASLLKAQGADGSWGGDPYVTALALRAFYLAGLTPNNPIQPGNQTTVLGTVSNGATGQALSGATLTITRTGSTPQTVSTNASGAYSISLPAGAVTVTVSAAGYNSVSTGLTLVAGTRLNFSPALLVVGNHFVNDLQCFACHVQTQTVVGGEHNLKFVQPEDPLRRAVLANAISQYQESDGGISYVFGGLRVVNSTLALWALNQWHSPDSVAATKNAMARFLASTQSPDGTWPVEHPYAWWRSTPPHTGLNTSSLVEVRAAAAAGATQTKPDWKFLSIPALPGGDMALAADTSGNLYVGAVDAQQIWRVDPQGQAQLLTSQFPVTSLSYVASGKFLVTAQTGVY